ncbi:MAG: ATP-binding cassette domain-containing protein, partial [Planctomycetota bacterium]
ARGPSPRVVEVAAMFGLGADQSQTVDVVRPTAVTLRPGQLVFVTGASGSGKSTLLRLIAEALDARRPPDVDVIDFAGLAPPPDRALIDAVDDGELPLDRALRILSLAGLNDAFVMLRRPSELSDGQRYRFQLARTMAKVETASNAQGGPNSETDGAGFSVVLADEFGATLDRTTAAGVARNVRRWVTPSANICFVAATTHDDLLEPLAPDTLIEKHLGGGIDVVEAERE